MYVEENPNLEVFPFDCVPTSRPKGSWTNGVKAYTKTGGAVGWFYPPRMRNRKHHNRKGPKPINQRLIMNEEEE